MFHGKGFGSLLGTGTSFSYTLNSQSLKKLWKTITFQNTDDDDKGSIEDQDNKGTNNIEQNNFNSADNNINENSPSRQKSSDDNLQYDSDGYLITDVPWNINFSYSINMSRGEYNVQKNGFDYRFSQSLMFSGNIQPTKGWSFNFNSSYDFENHKLANLTIGITRDLHCWSLTASAIPIGPYKSYSINIGVKSSLLQDLKWDKHDFARPGGWY